MPADQAIVTRLLSGGSVETLPSARLRDARENLSALITRARNDCKAFGADLPFDAPVWDVTDHAQTRASSATKSKKLYFTTNEGLNSKNMKGRQPLAEPFGAFVKAMVRLRHEANPRTPENHGVLVRAARYLHDALSEKSKIEPCDLLLDDFVLAADLCRNREAPSSCYRVGIFLGEIADTMYRFGVSKTRIVFKNPFPRDSGASDSRFGKKFEARRAAKLPSNEILETLTQIANQVEEPPDIIRMRAIELLWCGGWRINEVLTLPVDCEVREFVTNEKGEAIERYGIRYWPEKGADPRVKWMPTIVIDVAKRAIRDIRTYTASARAVARWLEEHPGRAYLPKQFPDRGPGQLISASDLEDMFGLVKYKGRQWITGRKMPFEIINRIWHVRRCDLEKALLAQQPKLAMSGLPLTLSQYLFIMPLNFLHSERATNPCVIDFVTDQHIGDFLSGRESSRGRILSVFERLGFTMLDGSAMAMTSHQFRHWLNTVAQEGGLGQHLIAKWFGRKTEMDNPAYDHRTGVQMAERLRDLMQQGKVQGAITVAWSGLDPVRRDTFRDTHFATAHTTDLGLCFNDWSLAPCPNHGGCGACGDHLLEKGNQEQKARAEKLLAEHEWLLAQAEQEADEDTYGASNYVEHNRIMVAGLRNIVAVHSDLSIPDGTVVHANPTSPSHYPDRLLE